MNLDGIRNTGTECPYDGLIETNFDGTGYPTNWLYQFDSVLHLVMYKDPQGILCGILSGRAQNMLTMRTGHLMMLKTKSHADFLL